MLDIYDIDYQLLKNMCTAGGNALFDQLVDIDDIDEQVYVYNADKIVVTCLYILHMCLDIIYTLSRHYLDIYYLDII